MWRGSLKLPVELMALSNEQWRWIMRRDNEHCEVIIQDKLVEYQRIHTWNGPGCAHVSRCSKVHIENATHSLQDDHPAKMFKIHHWLCPGIALIAHSSQPHRSKAWTINQHDIKNFSSSTFDILSPRNEVEWRPRSLLKMLAISVVLCVSSSDFNFN